MWESEFTAAVAVHVVSYFVQGVTPPRTHCLRRGCVDGVAQKRL